MPVARKSSVKLFVFLALFTLPLAAAVEVVKPEQVGLSSERLQRINQVIQRHVDAGNISGAITVVARKGSVAHLQAQGLMDVESKTPMALDAVFRLASMTKPVVGVSILMLVEEGKIRINDPVSRFIPAFKQLKVAVADLSGAAPIGAGTSPPGIPFTTVPANREITIRDLLTHTSGLVSGAISAQEAAKAPRKSAETLAVYIPRLAVFPLEFQPGTRWAYSPGAGFDTLARVVEIASGQSFDQFLRQRIFEPLGMKDTFFGPPEGRQSRVASIYAKTGNGLEKRPTTDPRALAGNVYFSGAGGLSGTTEDYLRFAQMLLNGGLLNGKRLLGSRTVEWMTTVHTPENLPGRRPGQGFGLSVRVINDSGAGPTMLTEGSFGWGGAYGTLFWVDPKKQLIGLLMIQARPNTEIRTDFESAVMQALVD